MIKEIDYSEDECKASEHEKFIEIDEYASESLPVYSEDERLEDFSDIESSDDEYEDEIFASSKEDLDRHSIGPELKDEALYLAKKAMIPDDFFRTGDLNSRFEIYNAILDWPESTPESYSYKFARVAPVYDLFLYSWKIVHKRFNHDLYDNVRNEVEAAFMECILETMDKYEPSEAKLGDYFGKNIYGAVYKFLCGSENITRHGIDHHDVRALRYMQKFQTHFKGANYAKIEDGDYVLEMHNTFQNNNHLSRERLTRLMSILDGGGDVRLDLMEDPDEVLANDSFYRGRYVNPEEEATRNVLRKDVASIILEHAESQTDAAAFIRYYYHTEAEDHVSIEDVVEEFYSGEVTRSVVECKFERILQKLKADSRMMEIFGRMRSLRDGNVFINASDDLSEYEISDGLFIDI